MENNEFKFLGQKAESTTLIIGLLLILFGVFVSIISQSQSFTSFIPSILGLPLFLSGFAATLFKSKKSLFMHIAVIFGLIIFVAADLSNSAAGEDAVAPGHDSCDHFT